MLSRALARQFSTTRAAQFATSRALLDSHRSNPLVGNTATPRAQAEVPPPPPPPKAENEAPPPPPRAQAQVRIPPKPLSKKFDAGYNATANINISSIIGTHEAEYARQHDPNTGPKIRAKAVAGRTVFIKDRLTPTSAPTPMVALRVLDRMCRDQKIRTKFHSQKFHERKGLKKKRLRSQRWRARFKTGFKAAVSRVIELKKQGW